MQLLRSKIVQQEIFGVQNKTCAGSVLYLFVCFFVTIVTTSIFCTSTHKPVKNICIFSGTNRPQTCVRCGLKIMKTMFRNHQKSIFLKKFLCGQALVIFQVLQGGLQKKYLMTSIIKYVLGVVTVCTPYINYLNIRFLAVFDFIGFAYMVVF